jgi:hypothetical protein
MHQIEAASNSGFADTTTGKISFLVLTAVLGFVSAWVLAQINRKKEPHKQISWDMDVERGLVAVSPSIREHVKVLYEDRLIDNLCVVRFRAANTGNRVIKNQYIRFKFSEQTTILDEGPDPLPSRELGIEHELVPDLSRNETRYLIKHFESGQEVAFLFVVAGKDAGPPIPYPWNDEGDVDFAPRGAARVTEDVEHVKPFAFWVLLYWLVPGFFFFANDFGFFGSSFAALVQLIFLIPILPHVAPMARLVQRYVVKLTAEAKAGQEVHISGAEKIAFLS